MALTKEQIKEFKAEEEAEDFYGLSNVADDIAGAGDKEWAKKVYKKAEGKAERYNDFRNLADSIYRLGDKEWAKKLYKKAEEKRKVQMTKILISSLYLQAVFMKI